MLATALGSGVALAAAQANDRHEEQLRRLRLQVQALQTQLQQALDQAQEAARGQAVAAASGQQAQTSLAAARAAAARAAALAQGRLVELQAVQTERDALRSVARDLQQQFAEAQATLQQRNTALEDGIQSAVARSRELERTEQARLRLQASLLQCADHNRSLLKLNEELVQRMLSTGLWERFSASEPFFQLRRVQLETLAQTYRNQALQATLLSTPAAASAAVDGSASAPSR